MPNFENVLITIIFNRYNVLCGSVRKSDAYKIHNFMTELRTLKGIDSRRQGLQDSSVVCPP